MTRVLKALGAVVGVLAVAALTYGSLVEPRLILDARRYTWPLPGLDEDSAGATIAVFSDLQVGMWLANTGMIRRVVDDVVDAEPAAVLLAGDFVYSAEPDVPTQVDAVVELLAPLTQAGLPVFAVMGNHDHRVDAVDELTKAFDDVGVRVLQNTAATLLIDAAEPLHVVGIGPEIPGESRPEAAFDGVPSDAARVVVMHNPSTFTAIAAHRAPLAVAGHTHCGQIAIPGTPLWSYFELRAEDRIVVDGFAPPDYGAEGNQLFVTCGVGFSRVPVRLGAPPQLVYIEAVPP